MPSIGPELPPHLRQQTRDSEEIGPQTLSGLVPVQDDNDNDDDDDDGYVPELPPDLAASRSATGPVKSSESQSPTKPVAGPSVPSRPPGHSPSLPNNNHSTYEDDDDDDIGPMPLPVGVQLPEKSAVQEFLEREERRRKAAQEATIPKPLKRDEWMLVPPSASELLGNIDPTKAKARQFSRSTAPTSSKKADTSLWTETPAERQQRLADEVTGKKRRVTDVSDSVGEEEGVGGDGKRRRREEEGIRRGVDEYTQKVRGPSLLAQHAASEKAEAASKKDEEGGIWDHSRDMSIGGRLMDDSKRSKLIREAQGLSDRFGSGKGGSFL